MTGARASSPDSDLPYMGEAGKTRVTPVHVLLRGGAVRSALVHRCVNVATDPKLRDAVLAGSLHRFDSGEELAIPYVYHDPAARRFALVIPPALRHEALRERARLQAAIAEDTAHTVPDYVRASVVVIGGADLIAFIQAHPASKPPAADATARDATDPSIDARERDIAIREQELQLAAIRLEDERRVLQKRAAEIELRFDEVVARERAAGATGQHEVPDLENVEDADDALIDAALARASEYESEEGPDAPLSVEDAELEGADDDEVGDDDVEDDLEDLLSREDITQNRSVNSTDPALQAMRALDGLEGQEAGDFVEELRDEEVESVEDRGEPTGVGPAPAGLLRAEVTTLDVQLPDGPSTRSSAPPRAFVSDIPSRQEPLKHGAPTSLFLDTDAQMAAVSREGIELHVKLDSARGDAFSNGAELVAQLSLIGDYPVALLSLVENTTERPYVRRAALDPRREPDVAILESLRSGFEASVFLYASGASMVRTFKVKSARENNVAAILERAKRAKPDPALDSGTALERALAAPPPLRDPQSPYSGELKFTAATAAEGREALRRVVPWLAGPQFDRALFVIGTPVPVLDAALGPVVALAKQFGLNLPAPVRDRAVSTGAVSSRAALVIDQIASLYALSEQKDRGGLSGEEIAAEWEGLLGEVGSCGAEIDLDKAERGWETVQRFKKNEAKLDVAKRASSAKDLEALTDIDLGALLDHPRFRSAAALALVRHGDAASIAPVFKELANMSPRDVAKVVGRAIQYGEVAGDALLDALNSPKSYVRHAAALALGQLKLRRAIVPLTLALQNESSDMWRDIGRVLGEFGHASERHVVRSVRDSRVAKDRLAWTLAHLAAHGSRKTLQEIVDSTTEDAAVRAVARDAIVLEDSARSYALEARSERGYDGLDPVLLVARAFYQETVSVAAPAGIAAAKSLESN